MEGSEALADVGAWLGRRESSEDQLTLAPAAALAATLDRAEMPGEGDELPLLWHWLYFLPKVRQSELGPDGHPARGGFLPPVTLPRRMWAAGRVTVRRPLVIGSLVRRESTIASIEPKQGRSGALVFVTVRHEIHDAKGHAISEEQHIVYRDAARGAASLPANPEPGAGAWRRSVRADPTLLFRYSALTFNGHRIHYDRPYAVGTEGYPGLVVHGPLIATLLVEGLHRAHPASRIRELRFRALRPLFGDDEVVATGEAPGSALSCRLWAPDPRGGIAMDAEVTME